MIKHYEYMLKNFDKYDSGLSKDEFIELLNILESNGEDYDSFYNAIFNGHTEFCGIYRNGDPWATQRELFETLKEFNLFIKKEDFKKVMEDRANDVLHDSQSFDEVRELFEWELENLTTTTDGFLNTLNIDRPGRAHNGRFETTLY